MMDMGAEAITRRRGGTQGRHHERGSAPIIQRRPVVRRILDYEYFTEDGLERIHQASMTILEEVGIDFRDAVALEAWRKAGAKVVGERVHIDRGLLMETLAHAPSEFVQHARNPERSVTVGGRNTIFVPTYGSPFVRDLDNKRRSIGSASCRDRLTSG